MADGHAYQILELSKTNDSKIKGKELQVFMQLFTFYNSNKCSYRLKSIFFSLSVLTKNLWSLLGVALIYPSIMTSNVIFSLRLANASSAIFAAIFV